MTPRIFVFSQPARAGRRRALSLIEVLSAIFVLSVGLLGVLSVIPYGIYQVKRTSIADHGNSLIRSAKAEIAVREWSQPKMDFIAGGAQSSNANAAAPIDNSGLITSADFTTPPAPGLAMRRIKLNENFGSAVYANTPGPNDKAPVYHWAFFQPNENPLPDVSDIDVQNRGSHRAVDCTLPLVVDPLAFSMSYNVLNSYGIYATDAVTDTVPTDVAAFRVSIGHPWGVSDQNINIHHADYATDDTARLFSQNYIQNTFLGSEDLLYTQPKDVIDHLLGEGASRTAMTTVNDVPMSRGDYSWFFMYTAKLDTYENPDPRVTLNDIPAGDVEFYADVLACFQRSPDIVGTSFPERRERIFYDNNNVFVNFMTTQGGMVTLTAHKGQSLDTKNTRYLLLIGPDDTAFPKIYNTSSNNYPRIGLWYKILSKADHGNQATFMLDNEKFKGYSGKGEGGFPECWTDDNWLGSGARPPLQAVIIDGVVNHYRFTP